MKRELKVQAFSVSKAGNRPEENEDCFLCRHKSSALVALSDGATESALSRVWADVLVHSSWKSSLLGKHMGATGPMPEAVVREWLGPLRDRFFHQHVNRERPWYSREKVRQGAHATFLAFRMNERGRWKAVTCGDTCLFSVSDGRICASLPVSHSSEFNNQPNLILSDRNGPLPPLMMHNDQQIKTGKQYIFATDALAAWLLGDAQSSTRLSRLLDCQSPAAFNQLVEEERGRGNLRNDDTTAVLLQRQ